MLTITVVTGSVMQALDSTVVNIASASIGRQLHASVSSVQWVITAYLLTLSMVILLTGWAVERFGANEVFLASVAGFVVTSALCASAWSVGSLVAFRVLQGISGGLTGPVGHAILARAAGPSRVGRVMSVLGITTTLAPVFGPVVGGVLLATGTWRWIFLINLPIGLVTLALGVRHLPRGARSDRVPGPPLDTRGLALLAPGVALIVYGLSSVATAGLFGGARSAFPVGLGAALVVVFILHARRLGDRALLKLRLFRDRVFRSATAVTALGGASLYGANFLLPLFLQLGQGRSAFASGMLLIPQGAGAAAANWPSGRLTDRYGSGRVVPWGLVAVFGGTVVFAFADRHAPVALMVVALAVRGAGIGCTVVPTMAGAYSHLPPEDLAHASSTVLLTQRLGGSMGTALTATLVQYRLSHAGLGSAHSLATVSALPATALARVGDRLSGVFHLPFAVVAASIGFALLPALGLPRPPRGNRAAISHLPITNVAPGPNSPAAPPAP
jgi:EmrB/QacA subfamily drug resistance transporter